MTDPKEVDHIISQTTSPGLFLSQIATQPVEWLWHNRIPLGTITLLDGGPDMGKSLLAIDIAARVSTGTPMPDGTPCKQANVILIAPEDNPSDTLRPRLEAAGGDPAHILLLNTVASLDPQKQQETNRPFSLFHDLELLEQTIQHTNTSLVILDPLIAAITSSRDQNTRAILTSLTKIAERTHCAILAIRHLNKSTSANALHSSTGSNIIGISARIGLLVTPHPYAENKRILSTSKNTLSQRANNLSYSIIANTSGIPSIQWLEENTYPLSTLLDKGTNLSLSITRQQILQVLTDASEPLAAPEITERTGQKYPTVRITLTRMYADGEIMRVSRGRYRIINYPPRPQGNQNIKATATTETSETIILPQ